MKDLIKLILLLSLHSCKDDCTKEVTFENMNSGELMVKVVEDCFPQCTEPVTIIFIGGHASKTIPYNKDHVKVHALLTGCCESLETYDLPDCENLIQIDF